MSFKKITQQTREAVRQSESLQEFFGTLNLDFTKGAFLTEVGSEQVQTELISLTTTPKDLSHRLNRPYRGFLVIERSSGAIIFNTRNQDDNILIRLTSSASTVARIWVF